MLVNVLEYEFIGCFENGWFGPAGVVAGLEAIQEGVEETVTFVAAVHPKSEIDAGEIKATIVIGKAMIEGRSTWRICGESGQPDGVNSHTLCRGGNLAEAAASLVQRLYAEAGITNIGIFRQPDTELQTHSFTFRGYEVIVTSRSHTRHSYSVYYNEDCILDDADASLPIGEYKKTYKNPYKKSNWDIMKEIAKIKL